MTTTETTSTNATATTTTVKPAITYHMFDTQARKPRRVNIPEAEYSQLVVPDTLEDRRAARVALETDARSRGLRGSSRPLDDAKEDFKFIASTGEILRIVKFRYQRDATAVDLEAIKALLSAKA